MSKHTAKSFDTSYRTILVHVDASRSADARIAFAAQLALAHDAHLVGMAQTGILAYIYGTTADGYFGDATPLFETMRTETEGRAARFDELADKAGVVSFEHRIGDDEPGYALASQGMYADLVIVGQSDPEAPDTAHAALPEYVALHAPCPVLVLPYAGQAGRAIERVLIAWNASPESARAVRQAMPLLARARQVEVTTFGRDDADDARLGGPELALFLARHGINVKVWQGRSEHENADALLARLSDQQADLLVMGCYGHTRFREIVLGGFSRTILSSMTVPTLLAH